jgi:preprotein translocase subunit SecG
MDLLKGLVFLLLVVSAVFLILVVMVQRGKGGGLAGALGGMGGQSAFGTKAGDLFTRITIGVAAVWIVVSMVAVKLYATGGGVLSEQMGSAPAAAPAPTTGEAPAPTTESAGKAAPAEKAPAAPAEKPATPPAK